MRILIIVLLAIAVIGCQAENPICNDLYCIDGEIYLKSELPKDVEFDTVNVDTADLLATLGTIPSTVDANTQENGSVTVADIVADTNTGGSAYEGQIHTITGVVKSIFDQSDGMTLQSGNNNVTFFVLMYGRPERKSTYEVGQSYDFQLYIHDQALSINDGSYNVWTHLVSNAEPQAVTIATLNTHAKNSNQQYQGSIITLKAEINTITDTSFHLRGNEIGVGLTIRRSGHTRESEYQKNQMYDFTLFVMKVGAWVIGSEVRMGLVM